LDGIEERIGSLGIEHFVAIHHGHQVFGLGQVNDVVRIAGEHVHGSYIITAYFPLQHTALGVVEVTLLDKTVALHHNELLELGVVPVLALGDAGLGDVDAHLAGIEGVDQLGKGAAVVHIHLEGEGHFLLGQVAEVGAVELLGKATLRDFGNKQGLRLSSKLLQQFNYFAKRYLMCYWTVTVLAVCLRQHVKSIELAPVFAALEAGYHLVHQVVYIQELQLYTGVVDGVGQVAGKGVAEGGHGTVVVGAAPLAKEVGKAINQDLCTRFFLVL